MRELIERQTSKEIRRLTMVLRKRRFRLHVTRSSLIILSLLFPFEISISSLKQR